MIQDMHRGAVANIPLAVSAITYGGVLGVLSGQQDISWLEILCMKTDLFITGGLAAILITAAITYALRFGGLMLADRLPRTGPVRRFLDALPGTILLSLVVPAAIHAGWVGAFGLVACLAVYIKSKNLLLTMAGGVLAVWLFRQVS